MFLSEGKDTQARLVQALQLGAIQEFEKSQGTISSHNIVGHRRVGKTVGTGLCTEYLTSKFLKETSIFNIRKDVDSSYPKIGFVAETKRQAREIVWNIMRDRLKKFIGFKAHNIDMKITIPRPLLGDYISVDILAYRNHDNIRGTKYRVIFPDEMQLCPEDAYKKSITNTLADSGGCIISTGTANSEGFYRKHLKECIENGSFPYILSADRTGVFSPQELKDLEATIGYHAFQQEYMCNFLASPFGTFYADVLDVLEKDISFYTAERNRDKPLIMSCDIGVGNGMVVWLAQADLATQRIELLDYKEGFDDTNNLRKELTEDGLLPDIIVLPWDSETKKLGKERPYTTRDLFIETFPECEITGLKKGRDKQKLVDISRVKNHLHLLKVPSTLAPTECFRGIKKLKNYRKKILSTGEVTNAIDKGNGNDHCADALLHLMVYLQIRDNKFHYEPDYKIGREDHLAYTLSGEVNNTFGSNEDYSAEKPLYSA